MQSIPTLLKDILGLFLVSTILGLTAQTILPNGIGIKTELTLVGSDSSGTVIPSVTINPNGDSNEANSISLEQAYSAYLEGSVIFLDARDQVAYQQGHILGAINLPAHAFMDSLSLLDELDSEQILITYCDGVDCNASIDLAGDLTMMGFTRVFFFFGGWQEWQTADYPTGSSP